MYKLETNKLTPTVYHVNGYYNTQKKDNPQDSTSNER